MQANLRDIEDSVPVHCKKARIAVKRVILFLLVEGLDFSLLKHSTCEAQWRKEQ